MFCATLTTHLQCTGLLPAHVHGNVGAFPSSSSETMPYVGRNDFPVSLLESLIVIIAMCQHHEK